MKIFFRNEGAIKAVSDKAKLREFVPDPERTAGSSLSRKEMVKEGSGT